MSAPSWPQIIELGVLATCLSLHGAQLPLRGYTTADGLPNNAISGIAPDSRGFLWFATLEGLSRFDGLRFANPAGVPRSRVRQLLIGRRGNYWLATPDGLIRFLPDLPPSSRDRVVVIRPDGKPQAGSILTLLEDRAGKLWCGTERGLYAIEDAAQAPRLAEVRIGLPGVSWGDSEVTGLAEDGEGGVWIGTGDGMLYRRASDGQVERHATTLPVGQVGITHLLVDRKGRLWVGRILGLDRSRPAPHPGANGFERLYEQRDGPPQRHVFDIFESREGDIWVAMYRCLAQFPADGSPVRIWTKDNGLPSRGIGSIGQDRDGNLWLGTGDQGAVRLAADGILTYSSQDGTAVDAVISIAETRDGELYFAGRLESEGFRIGARSGEGFRAITPRVPNWVTYFGWRPARTILQDRTGEWWLATHQGLCRYPRLDHPLQLSQTAPEAIYKVRNGLPGDVVTRLYEDHGGNIWVGTETRELAYWSRNGQRFIRVAADGTFGFASAFGEDAVGNVWIGDEDGQLWRMRDGRATPIATPAGKAPIHDIRLDHAGRLWVATGGQGLLRFDEPTASVPRFKQYGYSDGLSSLYLQSLAEDRNGSIYVGTRGGVDRLEPDLTHVRHFTSGDGIAAGVVNAAYCDRTGAIWLGTNHGLTRLVPQNGPANAPPAVWITGLSIGGVPTSVSEAGESGIRRIDVPSGQDQIEFDFVGPSYSPGDVLRYEYRLGDARWSEPMETRSVHYGALAPAQYRFAVRAINSDGEVSPAPATVEFRVMPPLWNRAWFQTILLVLMIAGAVSLHRARAARLLEIERVRSNIALDLHDDIASNLSQITIFSEIAMREAGPASPALEPLGRIAETARDTVECISDIVWSIRPQKEGDLQQRIRRVGSDALTSRQIEVSFHFSEEVRHLILHPNTRRQVYLIYKEAVHNIVRHARAVAVEISMSVDGPTLVLKVVDNGEGFESPEEGNGLPGMRTRAASLGGTLAIRSGIGKGAEVELRVPWKRPWHYPILRG